jgi:soluble P-type ATPase
MLELRIPGHKPLNLFYLVLDYNGTIACDGRIIQGVKERLELLARSLEVHILTADTFGSAQKELSGVPFRLTVIPRENQAEEAKRDYVEKLGREHSVCIGNGRNDRLMLKEAALGIAVIQVEGAAVAAILEADIVTFSILDALDLLLHPLRLSATLRS